MTNAGANLQGLVVMDNGMIAACDSGRHGIYLINPTNGAISTLTGFNGAGDNTGVNNRGLPPQSHCQVLTSPWAWPRRATTF